MPQASSKFNVAGPSMSLISRFRRLFGGAFVLCMIPALATGTPLISKSYGYFNIDGKTAEALDRELEWHGPLPKTPGHRHPGATQIKFGGDVPNTETTSGREREGQS